MRKVKDNKRLILVGIVALLIITAIIMTFFKNEQPSAQGKVAYELVDSRIENNTAIISVKATVEKGNRVDPIRQVRLIEDNSLSIYPINGYPKIEMKSGEQKEFSFSFHFPSTEKGQLEISNSVGQTEQLPLNFPEVAQREKTVTSSDVSLGIGEDLTIGNQEKYLVNNYRFSQVGTQLPPENMSYLTLNITLENISANDVIYPNPERFSLTDKDGKSLERVDQKLVGVKVAQKASIMPGEKTPMEVSFIVPKNGKEFYLYLNKSKIFTVQRTDSLAGQ